MEYISVRTAAEKWKISQRLVQKYCAMGRIDGAKKFGASWEIPAGAAKPQDPRKTTDRQQKQQPKRPSLSCRGLLPLMNTPFEPGQCKVYIENMAEEPQKHMALAEYYYFSGQPEKAVREAELFLADPDSNIQLSACLLYAYANLPLGNIDKARYALLKVKEKLAAASADLPEIHAALSFVSLASAVLLHLPLPAGLPSIQESISFLPIGIRMFALYVHAHYTYLKKEYQKSLGIVETTLAMQTEQYPIPSIYLHLVAVMDYMSLKQKEQAKEHLLAAWELAKPDDFIEGFGEHHGLLGGMLESVIKPAYPEDFKRIIAITYRFSAGWRKIHNPDTGHHVADNLTTTEFAASMLAARGWTNAEIGEHMNISANTAKWHIANAMQKLNVGSRQDLKKYMLI